MNAIGNTVDTNVAVPGIEPMNARSVILSALLGSHPPVLPARAIIALAECFSLRPGTIRTSLSRMVANEELDVEDGRYRLTARLLERQREQDSGRTPPATSWDGRWYTVVAAPDRRTMAERRSFRSAMLGARLAELRPDIWMRPANIELPPFSADVITTRGTVDVLDVNALVHRLWPLDEIEGRAKQLREVVLRQRPVIDDHDDATLSTTFEISAAAVRFLRTEPQLPAELTPAVWTSTDLRVAYDQFAAAFSRQLRQFFATNSKRSC